MRPNDLIAYDCAQLSVEHLRDCAANLSAARSNPARLFLATKAAHSALVSALTAALTQFDSLGALTERAKERLGKAKLLHEYQTTDRRGSEFLDLSAVGLRPLLRKAWDAGLAPVGSEDEWVGRLVHIRDLIEHPRAVGLSSFTADYCIEPIRIAVEIAAGLIGRIRDLGDEKRQQGAVAAQAIEEACLGFYAISLP